MQKRAFYVYIVTNVSRTLYIGITNDLEHRVAQHKEGAIPGFTARYGLDRLVYFEEFDSVREAIAREKQLKGWTRAKKVALISAANPEWDELRP
ncbi:MAG: GIY-YIG nuclease family protein [Chloroflexi bacterium]|nr:GIY-YIG nuclease family protein [Chloroflexota bacterium]